ILAVRPENRRERRLPMHVLALDSSTIDVSLSVSEFANGEFLSLYSARFDLPHPSTQTSPGLVLSCLVGDAAREAGLKPNDVDVWAVGLGPGTGAWIDPSVEFMRRLAAGTGRPLGVISSLETLAVEAFQVKPGVGSVVVAILPSHRERHFYAA